MNRIINLTSLLLLLVMQQVKAQKKCLSGNCTNGAGVMLTNKQDTLITYFKNGLASKEVILASPKHTEYIIARVDSNSYYYRKNKEFDLVAKGSMSNDKLIDDKLKPEYYLLYKNGNLEYSKQKSKLFINKELNIIEGIAEKANANTTFVSNGKDYRFLHFKDSVLVAGMLFVADEDRYIYFVVKNNQLAFENAGDQVLFEKINTQLNKGFKFNYTTVVSKMQALDQSRTIDELYYNFWGSLQRKELKPILELMNKLNEDVIMFNNFIEPLK